MGTPLPRTEAKRTFVPAGIGTVTLSLLENAAARQLDAQNIMFARGCTTQSTMAESHANSLLTASKEPLGSERLEFCSFTSRVLRHPKSSRDQASPPPFDLACSWTRRVQSLGSSFHLLTAARGQSPLADGMGWP